MYFITEGFSQMNAHWTFAHYNVITYARDQVRRDKNTY